MSPAPIVELCESEAHFPDSLADWLGGEQINELVAEAIVEMAAVREDRFFEDIPRRDDFMLHLLVCCYATDLYESEDIARNCFDRQVTRASDGISPESLEIRRFRRSHRAEVEQCLSKVLEQAWQYKFGSGQESVSSGQNRTVNASDLPDALFPFAAEAQSRVRKAVCYDCWTRDW